MGLSLWWICCLFYFSFCWLFTLFCYNLLFMPVWRVKFVWISLGINVADMLGAECAYEQSCCEGHNVVVRILSCHSMWLQFKFILVCGGYRYHNGFCSQSPSVDSHTLHKQGGQHMIQNSRIITKGSKCFHSSLDVLHPLPGLFERCGCSTIYC